MRQNILWGRHPRSSSCTSQPKSKTGGDQAKPTRNHQNSIFFAPSNRNQWLQGTSTTHMKSLRLDFLCTLQSKPMFRGHGHRLQEACKRQFSKWGSGANGLCVTCAQEFLALGHGHHPRQTIKPHFSLCLPIVIHGSKARAPPTRNPPNSIFLTLPIESMALGHEHHPQETFKTQLCSRLPMKIHGSRARAPQHKKPSKHIFFTPSEQNDCLGPDHGPQDTC